MIQRVDSEEVTKLNLGSKSGETWFLTEDGLYEVLMQSRKPIARQFKKGVKKILREVRTTGGFIPTTQNDSPEEIMARALTIAQQTLARREERLKALEADNESKTRQIDLQQATIEQQNATIKEQAPKVSYYDETLQSVNTMTTTQIAKELGLDAPKLNQRLKQAGVIFRQSGMWMLRQPYSAWGLTATRTQTYTRSDGSTGTSMYTVWTERGRRFVHAVHDNSYNARKAGKTFEGKEVTV